MKVLGENMLADEKDKRQKLKVKSQKYDLFLSYYKSMLKKSFWHFVITLCPFVVKFKTLYHKESQRNVELFRHVPKRIKKAG